MLRFFAVIPVLFAATAAGCATADDAATSAAAVTAAGCDNAPCTARPVIFVHGHGGSSSDGNAIFAALTAAGERFDGVTLAGTADHAAWTANSLPRRSWLFAFSYYVKAGTDARGSFTAGAGRVGSEGQLTPDHSSYDQGFAHEYTHDFAAFVDDVLRATGASQVDVVAHSMGGLITRSYLTFVPGARGRVANVLFLSTPHLGVPAASEEGVISSSDPNWMPDHELTELDRWKITSHSDFSRPGISGTDTWPSQLMNAELALPVAPGLVMHCMKGSRDLFIVDDSANYARCADYQVVPGVDHGGILGSAPAIAEAKAVLGGTFAK